MKNTFNLKNSADFQNILKKGTWNPGDFMSLYLMKNDNDFNMMGIAVGKKFSKSSVKRNRVKRLIREAYRSSESRVKKGYSFVFLWKNDVDYSNVTYINVSNDLLKCLKKADILLNEEDEDA